MRKKLALTAEKSEQEVSEKETDSPGKAPTVLHHHLSPTPSSERRKVGSFRKRALENHLLVHTGEKPALLKNSEGLRLIIFISLNPEEPDTEPYWGEATFWMRICKSREKDFIS